MTKRRLDDGGFANVLRQKHRVDPIVKQEVAQNTFALLMKAQQRHSPKPTTNELSYKYFNAEQTQPLEKCHCCTRCSAYDKCTFCEFLMCRIVYNSVVPVNTYTVTPVLFWITLSLRIKYFAYHVNKTINQFHHIPVYLRLIKYAQSPYCINT
ncbi:unnamed protein product [Mucor hiemalis]